MRQIIILFLLFIPLMESQAQLYPYKWRIGGSAGFTNYHGDLSPYGSHNWRSFTKSFNYNENYTDRLSYQVYLERRLNKSIGLMLSVGQYQFAMSDRYVQPNGQLMVNAPNFDRSLNFRTEVRDIGLSLVFKPDNNKILSATSFIAPYFTLGFGYLDFDVNGDLFDDAGLPYDYSLPGIINNGNYETNLPPLLTERDEGYDLESFYTSFGLGIRFRLSSRFELFAQSDFKYAFTDFLDDVSGNYRQNYDNELQAYASKPGPNVVDPSNPIRGDGRNRNDWYIFHGFGIRVSLGKEKFLFQAPKILPNYSISQTSKSEKISPPIISDSSQENQELKEETISVPPQRPAQTIQNYYFTWINTQDQFPQDSLMKNMAIIGLDQEILHNRYKKGLVKEERNKIYTQLDSIDQLASQWRLDTTLTRNTLNRRLDQYQSDRFGYQFSLDSLRQADSRLDDDILNLEQQKRLRQSQYIGIKNYSKRDSVYYWKQMMAIPDQLDQSLSQIQRTGYAYAPITDEMSDRQTATGIQENWESPSYEKSFDNFRMEIQEEQAKRDSMLMRSFTNQESLEAYLRSIEERPATQFVPVESQSRRRQDRVQTSQRSRITVEDERQGESERQNRALRNAALIGGGVVAGAALSGGDSDQQNQPQYQQGVGAPVTTIDQSALADSTQINQDTTLMLNEDSTTIMPPIGLTEAETGSNTYQDSLSQPPALMPDPINPNSEISKIGDQQTTNQMPRQMAMMSPSAVGLPVTRTNVYFEVNQSTLNAAEKEKLVDLAYLLDAQEDMKIELVGFADNTGNVNYNLNLIEIRIAHVREVLINEMGVQEDRIVTKSGGVVVRGAQRTGSEQDRRVEVRLTTPN
ncbi:OmpA family protein [Pararhodonellum marinum]|uniref:OmpA family protein n=1 Tax=Pararhodonellum marinum TaxID=2755358 RepID=UPI00188F43B1|nr:OmpA family protein [Pararhodonellum marinum]